jgi:hypothetical protein
MKTIPAMINRITSSETRETRITPDKDSPGNGSMGLGSLRWTKDVNLRIIERREAGACRPADSPRQERSSGSVSLLFGSIHPDNRLVGYGRRRRGQFPVAFCRKKNLGLPIYLILTLFLTTYYYRTTHFAVIFR